MTITGLLVRFFLGYFLLLIVAGLTLNYFGLKGGTGVNIGILMAVLYWVCYAFGNKNKRYFTKSEKITAVIGMVVIDLVIQTIVTVAAISGDGGQFSAGTLVFALGFVTLLHAAAIYYFVCSSKKFLIKQNIISE